MASSVELFIHISNWFGANVGRMYALKCGSTSWTFFWTVDSCFTMNFNIGDGNIYLCMECLTWCRTSSPTNCCTLTGCHKTICTWFTFLLISTSIYFQYSLSFALVITYSVFIKLCFIYFFFIIDVFLYSHLTINFNLNNLINLHLKQTHDCVSTQDIVIKKFDSYRFLGLHVTENLCWTKNTVAPLKKGTVAAILYFIRLLKKAGLSHCPLIQPYQGLIELAHVALLSGSETPPRQNGKKTSQKI